MKKIKKMKLINVLLILIMMLTIVNPALAGLTMNPEKQTYNGGEEVSVTSSIYEGDTKISGGIDWYYVDDKGDSHSITGDGDSISFAVPENSSAQTVTSVVYAAYGAKKQWTSFDIAPNAATQDLGTVKVRVVDNVERPEEDVANLPVDYREPFGEILPLTEVAITEGLDMMDALKNALATKNITAYVADYGPDSYLTGIGPVTSEDGTRTVNKLSELDCGNKSGWMVALNDWFINAAANTFIVADGDVVEFCYTCNMGADLGADFNNNDTTLKALAVNKGVLSPVFAPETKEYTVTLPDETQIMIIPTAANKFNKVTIESENATYRSTDGIAVVDNQVITVSCGQNNYTITIVISNSDQDSADAVAALITALPAVADIALADREQIEAVRAAYDNLTGTQKALVTNYSVMVEAENKIAQMDADNQAAADNVIALITALPTVDFITLADKEQVEAARAGYEALSVEQKALVDNLATLTAAEAQIAALLNPGGSVARNYKNDFLLSTLDLELVEGERKEIVIFDTPRVGNDDQAFNRDDLIFDVNNVISVAESVYDGVVTVEKENIDGTAKGTKYYVKGLKEGVAQIKVTYDGYEGQDAIIAANVKKSGAAGPSLETDIELTKYDILYFTGDSLNYTFNIATDADATVTAHVYGQEYAEGSEQITVNLRDGYNTIVITSSNAGGKTTKVHNIRAKKIAYAIENLTRPGAQYYYEGDRIKISFTGLVIPVPKVSRVYNPAAVGVAYSCSMPRYSTVSGTFSQYDLATSNGIQLELTGAGDCLLSDGHINEHWFGSGLYSETPVGDAPPNTGAGQTDHRFSVIPDIHFTVKANEEYNPQLFTANIENTEDIWPGDEVEITIPDLDIETLAANHPEANPDDWMIRELIDSYTTFITDIPGLNMVKSDNAKNLEDLPKLKTIKFFVPEDTTPGTYILKGGYVWVEYGPDWWKKYTEYFKTKIPDITIEVKEPIPGEQHGSVIIANKTLKNKLALAAGKEDGYTKKLTKKELAGITGAVDLSGAGITDDDMAVMQYLKSVSKIILSNNPVITPATVKKETFDWTVAKSLDFCGCAGVTEIAAGAFKECVNLTAITLPDNVTSLGESSFYGCTGLVDINIPEGITSISDKCFYACKGLTHITLPDTVTTLGLKSFFNCINLESIKLSENLQEIGESCFAGCSALTDITLPDSLTTLGKGIFYGCYGLTSVKLPMNLQSIGDECFRSCSALKTVTLPDTVKTLGKWSFIFCASLTNVNIPSGLQSIGESCFGGTALSLVDLRGTNFTRQDVENAFPYTATLLLGKDAQLSPASGSIKLGEETLAITHAIPQDKTVVWGSSDTTVAAVADGLVTGVQAGTAVIYAKAGDDTYSGACQVTIVDSGAARLQELSLSGITLRETFDPSKYIYSAEIKGDVRNTIVTARAADAESTLKINNMAVADGAPSDPVNLNVGNNIIQIKVTSEDGTVTKTYSINITMKAIYAGDDYIIIGNPALQEKLAVAVGKESGYVGKLTFNELAAITGTINLSNLDITDDDMAIMKCLTGVSEINLSGNTAITYYTVKKDTFDWRTPKSLDFTGCTGVTAIMWNAFEECANLTGIKLPAAVKSIKSNAFWRCQNLASISIPHGVTSIGDSAFALCSALAEISLPDSIESLGDYCFAATGLKEITFPSGITAIPKGCLSECKNLQYVAVPGNVTEIGKSCFKWCTSIFILDLCKTNFTNVGSSWKVPASAVVLLPGADAKLSPGSGIIKPGETLSITHGIPSEKIIAWSSSNATVAAVTDGMVTGVANGTAVIAAKSNDNSHSGICRVTVTDDPVADTTAPEIAVEGLTDGATVYESALSFTVTIKDNVTVTVEPSVYLNGYEIEPVNGTYTTVLQQGVNTIVIEAKDEAGNKASNTFIVTYEIESKIISEAIEKVCDQILGTGVYSDWQAVGLAQAGKEIPASYRQNLIQNIIGNNGTFNRPTDYQRITLGVLAAGGDPLNIGGYNLLEKI